MRLQADQQTVRQWQIVWDMMSRPEGVTIQELVNITGFAERTVRRDLSSLQRAGLPVEETVSAHGRKHWRIREWKIDLALNFEEAGGLYLATRLLSSQVRGTLFSNAALRAFRKLESILTRGVRKFLDNWMQKVHITEAGISDYGLRQELIDQVSQAVEDRKITILIYQSPRSTEPVEYESYPLGLVLHRGSAYVEAWLPKSKKVQTFKLDRLQSCHVTAMQFSLPDGVDIARDLKSSFGLFRGDGPPKKVLLRFTGAEVTQYVIEKNWPTEVQKARQRDGSVLLELSVTAMEEVQSWTQSFGPSVEVLEPKELRDRVQQAAQRVVEMYAAARLPIPRRSKRISSNRSVSESASSSNAD